MDTVQIWPIVGSMVTLTGVFSAIMFAAFGTLRSSLHSEITAFGAGIDARFAEFESRVDARFSAVDARFSDFEARVDARFDAVDAKIDNLARVTDVRLSSLESDMHLVKAHLIGQKSA